MGIRAGEFRHRITLQQPVQTRNATGDMVTTYADVASVWAAIDWENGRRFESAKQLNSEAEGVVRIRYRSDVQADWRINYKTRYFQILSISNVRERGSEMMMTCKEALD